MAVSAAEGSGEVTSAEAEADAPASGVFGVEASPQAAMTATREAPFKGHVLPETERQRRRVVNSLRALVERGFSVPKRWTIFRRARCCPTFLGQIGKTVLALELDQRQ